MSLTVPRAGLDAGRAAQITITAPDIGGQIADFGQVLARKQAELVDDENRVQMRRTQLAMADDLGQARLAVSQLTDPAAIDAQWSAQEAAIRKKYLEPDETGAYAIADPKMREQLDLDFQQMRGQHGLAVGKQALDMRRSQGEAAWVTMQGDITARAATADPETLGQILTVGDQAIDDRLARGAISPEDAAREKAKLRGDVFSARADAMIEADPEGFLAATEADPETGALGEWAALGADLPRYQRMARGAIAERADREAKAAEIAAKERDAAIGKELQEMTGLMAKGFTVADERFLEDPQVQAHPQYAEAKAAQALRDETPGIRRKSVAELDKMIAAEMARPISHEWEAKRVEVLRGWRDEAMQRADSDFVGMAREADLPVPDLPDFDPGNPAPFAAGLAQRLAFDAGAVERGQTRTQAVFSADEKARIAKVLDPKADAGAKLTLLQAMAQGGGKQMDRALKAADADPVVARAAKVMTQTRNPALAGEILRGQQQIALGTVNMPADKQMVTVFDEVTGGVFANDPARKAEVLGAARALYAASAAGVNPDGADSVVPFMDDTEAQTMFGTAIQRVLGGGADRNGALSFGGVQDVRDRKVHLPPGVNGTQVEDALDAVAQRLAGQSQVAVQIGEAGQTGIVYETNDRVPLAERLKPLVAAGIGGAAPNLGANPAQQFARAYPVRVGESGVYELRYQHNGREYAVPVANDPQGRAWRFRLDDLMRGVKQ